MALAMRAGPSQDEIRRQNLGALLRYVHVHGATTRAELTTALGLNRSTIGALTADLAGAGLVSEGRRRRPAGPDDRHSSSSARVGAGLRVRVQRRGGPAAGSAGRLGGEVLDRREMDRPRNLVAGEAAPLLAGAVKEMHQSVPTDAICVGAGLAVCGMVRREDGWSGSARPPAGWTSRSVPRSPSSWG
ncbi:hypothetical protein V2I01_08445 [Micromonospora sp. BRA006-A]|nr:hypothetical protein [Micromonospora sp. BRA006-A]